MNSQEGYGEVKFWWSREDAANETELVVRGYVNARRQMAVCSFLHTKVDSLTATSVNSAVANRGVFSERATDCENNLTT